MSSDLSTRPPAVAFTVGQSDASAPPFNSNPEPPEIGARIRRIRDGERGSVRCITNIHNAPMAGIEWDKPVGKHNGTVNGETFFTCADNHGSMIRFDAIAPPRALADVLVERFESLNLPTTGKYKISGPQVHIPDEETGAFSRVQNIECSGNEEVQRVGFCGPTLAARFPNITDLSIAHTLFVSWTEIAIICDSLKKLKALNASRNPFGEFDASCKVSVRQTVVWSESLEEVTLSSTGLSPRCVPQLLAAFPALKSLNVGHNPIFEKFGDSEIIDAHHDHPNLTGVAVNGTGAKSLRQILHLLGETVCSRLKFINANDNAQLKCLRLPDSATSGEDDEATSSPKTAGDFFPNVDRLWLKNVGVDDWDELHTLHQLPSLKEVSFATEPLLAEHSDSMKRRWVVGFMPKSVQVLNHSKLQDSERRIAKQLILGTYQELRRKHREQQKMVDDLSSALAEAAVDREAQATERRALDDDSVQKETIEPPKIPRLVGEWLESVKDEEAPIYIPKPRLMVNAFNVTLWPLFFSSEEEHKAAYAKAFVEQVRLDDAHRNAKFEIDVRWSVGELIEHIGKRLDLAAKTEFMLYQLDSELMENEGAVRQGFHCKKMWCKTDSLHRWRWQETDVIVVAVVG